jgi:hypothetical protein
LIARLNDQFRQRGQSGTIVVTAGVVSLPAFDGLALQATLAGGDADKRGHRRWRRPDPGKN